MQHGGEDEDADGGALRGAPQGESSAGRADGGDAAAVDGEGQRGHRERVAQLRRMGHRVRLRGSRAHRAPSPRRVFMSSLYPAWSGSWGALYSSECLAMISEARKYPSPLQVPSTTAPRPSANRSGGVPLCLTAMVPWPSESDEVELDGLRIPLERARLDHAPEPVRLAGHGRRPELARRHEVDDGLAHPREDEVAEGGRDDEAAGDELDAPAHVRRLRLPAAAARARRAR